MKECLHYLTQNLTDVPENDDWLSGREQALLSKLRFPKRRNDWRLGRWTAKRAYSILVSDQTASISELDIIAAEDGSPGIYVGGGKASVNLSISHSHGSGFCAIAPENVAVGCDMERVGNESPGFFEDYFRPEETLFCREAPESIKSIAGYLIWSAKESCLKVLREGLRRDTRSVRIDVDFKGETGSWNNWTGHCMETAMVFHGWWRFEDGFIYTLASDKPNAIPRELKL